MTVFRNKKDGKLYKIYKIHRSMCLCAGRCGSYEAEALYEWNFIYNAKLEDFEVAWTT